MGPSVEYTLSPKPLSILMPVLFVLCSACERWPPAESDLREHFTEKRHAFEALAEKIRSSEFGHVSRGFGSEIYVVPAAGDYNDRFKPENSVDWLSLLDATRMSLVDRDSDNSVSFDASFLFPDSESRTGLIAYVNDAELHDSATICDPDHEKIPCGYCVVGLGDDWFISYLWIQTLFDRERYDAFVEGELSFDEYSYERDKAQEQCRVDGLNEMGYPVSDR